MYSSASDTVALFVGRTVAGTIASSTTWNENKIVVGDVTVSSGVTLTIDMNTVIRFDPARSLIANGQLTVAGQFDFRTTFAPTNINSTAWGTIRLNNSGANGSSLSNVDISHGTQIDILNCDNITVDGCTFSDMVNGINGYGSSGFIFGNTMTNMRDHGITLTEASFICNQNVIKKSSTYSQYHTGGGIIYNGGSSGDMWQNDIAGFEWGVGAIWGSSPTFYNEYNDGINNRITDCLYGVRAYQGGFPFICPPWGYEPYFGNSIYENNPYNIHWTSGGDCFAGWTYWGGEPPIRFYFDYNCQAYYDYWLTEDPWPSYAPLSNQNNSVQLSKRETFSGKGVQPALGKTGTTKETILDGITLLKQKKQREAKDFFMSYLSKHPNDGAAYVWLFNSYGAETANDVMSVFTSLSQSAAKDHLLLLSSLYLKRHDIAGAKAMNSKISAENPNTPLAVKAQLNNFYIALYHENDIAAASSLLADASMKTSLSNPIELSIAQDALEAQRKGDSFQPQPLPEPVTTAGLLQNYPNPFNPVTTITYRITQPGRVSLKVFDLLGREVARIFVGTQNEGVYTQQFDASQLSSGIYFYQLIAPGVKETRKMIIAK
jgi:hypothetical protein